MDHIIKPSLYSTIGYKKLIDFVDSFLPDAHSTTIVENNTCIHVVAKKGDYTFHFDFYEDEFNNLDPEIVFNPFIRDKKQMSISDSLSKIAPIVISIFDIPIGVSIPD